MSITGRLSPRQSPPQRDDHRPLSSGSGPSGRRWGLVAAGAAATILATAGGLAVWTGNTPLPGTAAGSGDRSSSDSRGAGVLSGPVDLPGRLRGFSPAAEGKDPTLNQKAQEKAMGLSAEVPLAARGYTGTTPDHTIRAFAARTDISPAWAEVWAVEDVQTVGSNQCTNHSRLAPGGPVAARPTVMLCWRTSASLSAYTLTINPAATVTPAEGSAALDEVWEAATHG